jgi:signal transduction histidine kinase
MKNFLQIRSKWLNNKILTIFISVIILLQFAFFALDTIYNTNIDNKYYQELIIQHTLALTEYLNDAPAKEQANIIKNAHLPDSVISVNRTPKWSLQIKDKSLWDISSKIKSEEKRIQASIQLRNGNWLNISANIVPFVSKLQNFFFIFQCIGTLLILFLLYLINKFTTSLMTIKGATNRLGIDFNTAPLTPTGSGLVRNTLQSINDLQKRIQELLQERTQMIAAISHDLKTPMTRIRLRMAAVSASQYEKNMADLDEMEAMINETLSFARDDDARLPKNLLDLSALLSAICEDYAALGHAVNYVGSEERVTLMGTSLSLKRAFTNLIDNALKYAGSAEVDLFTKDNFIHITIQDQGPGLTDEELKHVFTPFYRVQKSRSRKTGGTGLGLAIAKNIISTHFGTIHLERIAPQGLQVIVCFPCH